MKINKSLIALASLACASAVMADEGISYSLNLKSWNNSFKDGTSSASATNSSIVSFTAKKDVFYLTGSTILPTTYNFGNGAGLVRRDTDVAVGWMANSNISLLGGVKRASVNNFDYSGSLTYNTTPTFNFNYLGVNGFNSINEKQFIFGTATRSINGSRSLSGVKTTGLTFTTLEAGFGHVLSKDAQLTLGYRSQDLKFPDASGTVKMGGLIFGGNFNF